jgi:membrane protein YdbS with pleckstrin-like domain
MSIIKFECPHCQKTNEGDESLYGQQVKCSQCQGDVLVPARPVGAPLKTARLITEPFSPGPRPAALPEEEKDIFQISPVARAFLGQLLLGIAFILLGVSLVALARRWAWPLWTPLIPVGAGLIVFLLVWVKVKSYNYRLTNQRLLVRRGLMAKHIDELELYRIKDVMVDQGLLQRMLAYGTVSVVVADDTTPQVHLIGVPKPVDVKETIRTHYRAARLREGVHPTEFMESP